MAAKSDVKRRLEKLGLSLGIEYVDDPYPDAPGALSKYAIDGKQCRILIGNDVPLEARDYVLVTQAEAAYRAARGFPEFGQTPPEDSFISKLNVAAGQLVAAPAFKKRCDEIQIDAAAALSALPFGIDEGVAATDPQSHVFLLESLRLAPLLLIAPDWTEPIERVEAVSHGFEAVSRAEGMADFISQRDVLDVEPCWEAMIELIAYLGMDRVTGIADRGGRAYFGGRFHSQ